MATNATGPWQTSPQVTSLHRCVAKQPIRRKLGRWHFRVSQTEHHSESASFQPRYITH